MAKKSFKSLPDRIDILIAGGGYVGLSCATSIKSAAPHLVVGVVDPAKDAQIEKDERSSAIAADAARMLNTLGLWERLAETAQPINEMIVTDSKTNDISRPVFLTFSNEREGDEPFAHMIENRELVKALRSKADSLGVTRLEGEHVSGFANKASFCQAQLASGKTIETRLLIACDGVMSKLRDHAGIKTIHWPYDQKAIVCTVEHERDHGGRAEEHFLPAGPFAILPLKNKRSSLVWTEKTRDAEKLMAQDELVFDMELEQRFGHKLGNVSVVSKVQSFPLGLRLAREFVKSRFALAGDSAHGIHPIAGQGLNLGFKDAAALAETIVEADRLGLDFGTLDVLERYQMWRRFDTVRMGATTDVLNRLFSNDHDLVRGIRDFGLGLVERMPSLKRYFINQASGENSATPRLLRGEPI